MSLLLMGRVFATKFSSPTDKFVMLALVDHAWDEGTNCYPSQARLADITGYSVRAVRNSLERLRTEHRIEIMRGGWRGGRFERTEYLINVDRLAVKAPKGRPQTSDEDERTPAEADDTPPERGSSTPPGVPERRSSPPAPRAQESSVNPQGQKQPSENPLPLFAGEPVDAHERTTKNKPNPTLLFDVFWAAYPAHKHKAKQDALKAWEKLKPNEALVETILTALKAQAASWGWTKDDGRWVPNPATWLNGKRWTDAIESAPRPTLLPGAGLNGHAPGTGSTYVPPKNGFESHAFQPGAEEEEIARAQQAEAAARKAAMRARQGAAHAV